MSDDKNLSVGGYDFGDDADIELPNDPKFDAWITGAAPSVNAPNAAPRAEMWSEISSRVAAAKGSDELGARRFRQAKWFLPAALAAALILGIGIDRLVSDRRPVGQSASQPVALNPQPAPSATDSATPNKLYRMAAQQTLSQAEALLTAYRNGDATTRDPASVRQLTQWGRQVLSSTRLLIDSPAGDDPRLKPLLEDLEVVLVQVIQLTGAPLDSTERDLIDGAITKRHILPRIRSAVPAGAGDAATD